MGLGLRFLWRQAAHRPSGLLGAEGARPSLVSHVFPGLVEHFEFDGIDRLIVKPLRCTTCTHQPTGWYDMVSIARPSVGGNRRIQIALDPESYERVRQIAEDEERSVSAVAARLIRHALSGRRREAK